MTINSAHFLPGTNKKLGDHYLLLECLGDGTHGWVWRAERLADSKTVAVKIPKQIAKDDRSLAEGRELINAASHPNVIEIYDMGRVPPEKEWFAIEMEYFPSESLAQKLEERSHNFGNTYKRLFKIYDQVLQAVKHLTCLDTPVSHGDIKPHNILVGQNDLVKLTDFGSSALPEEIYVRTRENGGTVLYSAPEFSDCISRKGSFDELIKGDIYSLGVLLYQLMTGSLPHDTQSQVRSHAPFAKPTEVNSSICNQLEQLILQCLEKLPANRISTINELISKFRAASECQLSNAQQYSITNTLTENSTDWSSRVVEQLEKENYQQAAKLAELEYKKSGNESALLQQLNALYRQNKSFEFLNIYESGAHFNESQSEDAASARLLAIKVYLKRRITERAGKLIELAVKLDGTSYELKLLDASLSGLMADFEGAKRKLEALNIQRPKQPLLLKRLLHVCEQLRDYDAAAGYLRILLRLIRDDETLLAKRQQYIGLGVW